MAEDINSLKADGIKVTQVKVMQPGGGQEERYNVTFMVGQHGPFPLQFPVVGFKPEDARQAIVKKVEEIKGTLRAAQP